jgi:hypothetical protein
VPPMHLTAEPLPWMFPKSLNDVGTGTERSVKSHLFLLRHDSETHENVIADKQQA